MELGYELVLVHHGIKGMRWGIRRSPAQLGHRIEKLSKKNYKIEKKLNTNKELRAQKRIGKADRLLSKSIYYERKGEKYLRKSNPSLLVSKNRAAVNYMKYSKYARKSQRLRIRGTTMRSKASSYIAKQNTYKLKIEKNKRLMDTYKKTISALDKGSIQQGKFFMQYVK